MKAAVLRAFNEPFVIEERDIPTPGPGEVLVKVGACGMCGTDIKAWQGQKPEVVPPRVMGHEIAGTVVECGPGVIDLAPGAKGVVHFYYCCHNCRFCQTNRECLCEHMEGRLGFTIDGGFQEYIAVRAENFLSVGNDTKLSEACVATDAVATVYRGLQKTRIEPGDRVLVVGVGGLGVHAVQVAKALGGEVTGIDLDPRKLDYAKGYGLERGILFAADEAETAKALLEISGGGFDVILETVTRPETIAIDLKVLRVSGRLLMLGYGHTVPLPSFPIVRNEFSIYGSRGSTRQDVREVLALIDRGQVKPAVSGTFPLEGINEAFAQLMEGNVLGRQVIVFD